MNQHGSMGHWMGGATGVPAWVWEVFGTWIWAVLGVGIAITVVVTLIRRRGGR